ncbi:MAG: hypothetical protein HQK99_01435 [Nitrospirae bacterium]|nr:hypothetical protein [Nitrospirota bacterium]
MDRGNELERVVHQIEDMLVSAVDDRSISDYDLRQLLRFIAKVVQIVEQAFQDVFSVLIDFKYLSVEDFHSRRLVELRKNLDLLLARSRYRDAEEICSRLHHLREQFNTQIEPLVAHLQRYKEWQNLFWLIEEREGRIIRMVERTVYDISNMAGVLTESNISEINEEAGMMANNIKLPLDELRFLTNQIMGFSGRPGLLELTSDGSRSTLSEQANSIMINRGTVNVTRDTYNAGQAFQMGHNNHAKDITFHQIWNQQNGQIDLSALAMELPLLRSAMRKEATNPEHDISIGDIASAETSAIKKDGPSTLQHLKSAGKWALDVATKVGTGVATYAIKTALGL